MEQHVQLLMQILAVVAFILFLVAIIMSHRSWKWFMLTMVGLVFCLSGVFTVLSAMSLKTHESWRKQLVGPPGKAEEGLFYKTKHAEQVVIDLLHGKKDDDGEIVEDGIEQLKVKLREVVYDRGRVWIDCKPSAMAPGAKEVKVEVPGADAQRITQNLMVYLFEAKSIGNQGNFLGEFTVTEVAFPEAPGGEEDGEADAAPAAAAVGPSLITLQSAWPMDPREQNRVEKSSRLDHHWIMHDKMPVDGHFVFQNLEQVGAEELGVEPNELAGMKNADRLKKLLPASDPREYEKDHQPAEETDAADRVEVFVEFKKDYPEVFQEGAEQFKEDQKVWIAKESIGEGAEIILGADDLAQRDIVKILSDEKPRYSRQLRDYGISFRDSYIARGRQQDLIDDLDLETKSMNRVLTDKLAIIGRVNSEKNRLTNDQKGFEKDRQHVDKLLAELQSQQQKLDARLKKLRREIVQLAEQLDHKQMQAVQAIDRRTSRSAADRQQSTTRDSGPHVAASTAS